MLDASSNAMSPVLFNSLGLVTCVIIIAQIIYALKGPIFEFDGRLAKREVLSAIISFQVIMQLCFGFSLYAVRQTDLQNASFDGAYSYFISLQQSVLDNKASDYNALNLEKNMPGFVESVFLADDNYSGIDESDMINNYFRFPVSGGKLLMKKSQTYFSKRLQEFGVSLLMSLVISILLMAEMVYFFVKFIDSPKDRETAENGAAVYIRQISFLFYFTGYLGASFIPILARNMSGDNPNADFIAGLPYSAEALANCFAILLAARFFKKKGWKPPYVMGVCIFITGILSSALAPNVYLFIISRAVAGTGYGFCWMTMRNITALSDDITGNFSSLTSGIFAGIMCGVAFGAVLADQVGYRNVLLISSLMAVIAAVFPIILRNGAAESAGAQSAGIKLSFAHIAVFIVFLILFVIPACITEAFCGYMLPLYVNRFHFPTAYAGRASLVYNLCLVYISSNFLRKLIKKYFSNALFHNVLYMLLISLSLFAAAHIGGFQAMIITAALLGSADGFGYSVQNAFILNTSVSKKIGKAQMLTFFSLFKKFGVMLGPLVFGLFITNGFRGLSALGIGFLLCILIGATLIVFLGKKEALQ
jgi:predicted MFS family arabinose efflux permease